MKILGALVCLFAASVAGADGTVPDPIRAARARGELSAEESLIYGVYAVFGDSRLPERFKTTAAAPPDGDLALSEAAHSFPSLSRETRALLSPFFIPPIDSNSWYARRRAASSSDVGSPDDDYGLPPRCGTPDDMFSSVHTRRFRVWWEKSYPADKATAQQIADALEKTIRPKVVAWMSREPLSDEGVSGCHGGDSRLDVYLVEGLRGTAITAPYIGPWNHVPVYILINRWVRNPAILSLAAHEYAHAVQFAFAVKDEHMTAERSDWWMEATATYAQDFTYPDLQSEQPQAQMYLDHPEISIPKNSVHGTYVWPFYLSRKMDDAGIVRESFLAWERLPFVEALEATLPGGVGNSFGEVALHNLNRQPVDEYKKWDRLEAKVPFTDVPLLEPKADGVDTVELSGLTLPALAARYYLIAFGTGARSAIFDNTFAFHPTVRVQAVIRTDNDWRIEDWSQRRHRAFCFNDPQEKVSAVYLVISNGEWKDLSLEATPSGPFRVQASKIGCGRWTGSARYTRTFRSDDTSYDEEIVAENLAFEYRPRPDRVNGYSFAFENVGGTLRYRYDQTLELSRTTCHIHGELAALPIRHDDAALDIGAFRLDGPFGVYEASGVITDMDVPWVTDCQGVEPGIRGAIWWQVPSPPPWYRPFYVSPDGLTISGSYTIDADTDVTAEWRLQSER